MKQVCTTSCSLLIWLKRRKWTLLIFWYACGAMVAMIWGVNSPLGMSDSTSRVDISSYKLVKNQMGAFGYTRWDPAKNYRPLSAVYFDELNTTNGQIGFFKTAVYKIARVKGLRLRQFEYSSESKIVKRKYVRSGATPFEVLLEDAMSLIDGYKSVLPAPPGKDGFRIEVTVGDIDLSGVAQVSVNDFDYQSFSDRKLALSVQSKRAVASYKRPEMILRGHVTITAADGSKLESNRVKWDMKKNQFEVDGVYVLSRNGKKMFGKDTYVDRNLNVVGVAQARVLEKEVQKCFAKF